ncbi:hypothetical protein [Xanthomonas phage BUDD]|nr:hypothetical protein [Xanthomonas phage BUDD]
MEPITPAIIGASAVAALGGATMFLRRLARDKLELVRDRAEGNLIEDLIKQRDDARKEKADMETELLKIGAEADQCLEKVKELLSKEQQLRIQNAMLTQLLDKLATALDTSKAELASALGTANQSQVG